MSALTARSRFTFEPCFNEPRFVRRKVSGAAPILKYHVDLSPWLLNSVMVRHVPLTEMESPRCASPRMSAQLEMVREVPPPPEEVLSRELSSVTAVRKEWSDSASCCRYFFLNGNAETQGGTWARQGMIDSLPIVSTSPVNMVAIDLRTVFAKNSRQRKGILCRRLLQVGRMLLSPAAK